MDAPTGAARWFNRLDTDYKVSSESRLQTFDVSSLSSDNLYGWWVQHTETKHGVLSDRSKALLGQLQATNVDSEVFVVDCTGQVRFHKAGELDEDGYAELKSAIDSALYDVACPTRD